MGTLAATSVKVATGKVLKPSDFYPPTKARGARLSARQQRQLRELRARKRKPDG